MTITIDNNSFDRRRVALWAVALALIAAFAFMIWKFVGTVVLGLFAYYATRPIYERVHQRISSRTLAATVSILLVTLPALVVTAWTLVQAANQLATLVQSPLIEGYIKQLEAYVGFTGVTSTFTHTVQQILSGQIQPSDLLNGLSINAVIALLGASLTFLADVGFHSFIVLIIAFYLLRDDYRISAWARTTFVGEKNVVREYFDAIDYNLQSVYFGNIVNAFLTGTIGAITYSILNLFAPPEVRIPLPLLIGVLTGVASLIPLIGMKIVWVPLALGLLAESLFVAPQTIWFPITFAAVSVVFVDTIPDLILRPFVSGRRLHIGAVMLAYTIGPLLFGWYGIFFGPLILVVVVEFFRIVFPWLIGPTDEAETLRHVGRTDCSDSAAELNETDDASKFDDTAAASGSETEIDDNSVGSSGDHPTESSTDRPSGSNADRSRASSSIDDGQNEAEGDTSTHVGELQTRREEE